MSEKLIMPKNVQSFVDKYGGIGSKEQDSAFWKGFRKAANAYANVQAKRICDLEHALAEGKKNSSKIEDKLRVDLRGHPDSELWGEAGLIAATMRCVDALDTITEQRDEMTRYANKLAHGYPDGTLPKDFEVLREANLGLAVELTAVTEQRDSYKDRFESLLKQYAIETQQLTEQRDKLAKLSGFGEFDKQTELTER